MDTQLTADQPKTPAAVSTDADRTAIDQADADRQAILSSAPVSRAANTIRLQDAFLAAYAEAGSIRGAALAAGTVSRNTVEDWISGDWYGFRHRMAQAGRAFAESLQDTAVGWVRAQKPGSNPLMMIALLNAHWPEKYRRDAVPPDDTALRVLQEFRRLRSLEHGEPRALGPGSETQAPDA